MACSRLAIAASIAALLSVGCGSEPGSGSGSSDGSTTSAPETTTGDASADTEASTTAGPSEDTTGEGSSSSGEPGLDAECFEANSEADALIQISFADEEAWLAVEGWESPETHQVTLDCAVVEVTPEPDGYATLLECGPVEAPLGATVVHAAAPEGAPTWEPGLPVVLSSVASPDGVFGGGARGLALSSADGSQVLLAGLEGYQMILGQAVEAPMTVVEDSSYCVDDEWDEFEDPPRPMLLTATTTTEELTALGGHRGSVVADDGSVLVADIEVANRFNNFHDTREYRLLYQRVLAP